MKFIPDIDMKWLRKRTERIGPCLVWAGKGVRTNCPQARFATPDGDRVMWNLRRLVYCLTRELRPEDIDGVVIGTCCEEKLCLNPDHLIARTLSEACADTNRRNANDPVRCMKVALAKRAEMSDLTNEMVAEIRGSDRTLSELAKMYPGSRSTMGKIKRGEVWRDYSNPLTPMRLMR